MSNIALVIGLFVVPGILLWLGHRLRDRSDAQRRAFWGGVIGHTVAAFVALAALQLPAVLWGSDLRVALAFWSMLLGGALGMAVGAVTGRGR